METAIIVPVWKRPEVTRVCFENLAKTGCKVYCAVSETWAVELCHEFRFEQIYVENDTLGRKKNKLLEFTLCDPWDQVMEMGSDNLIDLNKLDDYLSIPNDHYGCSSLYFVDSVNEKAKYTNVPRKIWGAGRVISRKAVEECMPLWDDKGTKYLDAQANTALRKYPYSVVKGPMCVDIKSEVNLHPYERFHGREVDYEALQETFPELQSLTKPTHHV